MWVRRALDRAGRGARNLDQAGEATLERLRGMRSGAVMARMVEGVAVWMEIEAGQTAGDQLREVVRRMSHPADGYPRPQTESHNL